MKIKVELSDSEIRCAIEKAIKAKMPELSFYHSEIKIEGSVKIKNKAIRKQVQRMVAYVETSK